MAPSPLARSGLAVELISWQSRCVTGKYFNRLSKNDPLDWGAQFANYLVHKDGDLHREDVLQRIRAFLLRSPDVFSWWKAVLEDGNIRLSVHTEQPCVELNSFLEWNSVRTRLDEDALVTLWLSINAPPSVAAEYVISDLKSWRIFTRCFHPNLENALANGFAETHLHLMACESMAVLWGRIMHQHVRLEKVPRYAPRILSGLKINVERFDARQEEKSLVLDAIMWRRKAWRYLVGRQGLSDRVRVSPGCRSIYVTTANYLSEERTFLLAGWRRLASLVQAEKCKSLNDEDQEFIRLFDGYLVAKSKFLSEHHLFQEKGTGLRNFREYFDRGSIIGRWNIARDLSETCRLGDLAAEPSKLRMLELRISPKNSVSEYGKFFRDWDGLGSGKTRFESKCHQRIQKGEVSVGFVIHFIRNPDSDQIDRDDIAFSTLRQRLDRQSTILNAFRSRYKVLARHVVGLDVANFERGCPPELFAPYLRLLRGDIDGVFKCHGKAAYEPIELPFWQRTCPQRMPLSSRRLGLSFHAGEDCYHVVDGLRHMHGLAANLLIAGDRIGHGVAAGRPVHPVGGDLLIPRGVLLDNIVWMRLIGIKNGLLAPSVETILASMMRSLSKKLYGNPIDVIALFELQGLRYELPPRKTDKCRQKDNSVEHLYWQETYDKSVRLKRKEFASSDEVRVFAGCGETVEALQKFVRGELKRKGVYIEACPTSNIATGALAAINEHPLLVSISDGDLRPFITVNTDDPGVFATRLDNEYACVFSELVEVLKGDLGLAQKVIQDLCASSVHSSFLDNPDHL